MCSDQAAPPLTTHIPYTTLFRSPNRVRGWDLLDRSGLLRAILPELDAMKGCLQPEQFHPEGDVFQHTRLMLELDRKSTRLNSSHQIISYAVICLKKKNIDITHGS